MAKNCKLKMLFIILLLTMLLFSGAFASLVSIVNAAEPTVQDKTLEILNEVVGINTEEYATVRSSQLDNSYRNLPQKEVDISLVSEQGGFRASCSFVNNMLRQIYLSAYEGELAVEQPAIATTDMAKNFLLRYQTYTGDSFYGELASTLEDIDVNTNVTKSAGNIKLEVLNSDNIILDYTWTYTDANGLVAKSKNVILSYDQGQLKVFLNNWPLYKVVGTPKISSEEATAIALEVSKSFSYEVKIDNVTSTVTGFNIDSKSLGYTELSYLNFPNQSLARGGDPFTLYPSWYVPLGFDKSYSGGVTGMTVSIWADTGEVSIMGPMITGLSSTTSADEEVSIISIDGEAITDGINQEATVLNAPIVIVAMFSLVGVTLVCEKKARFAGNRKLFLRLWGTLLCGIILFSVILVAVPAVTASSTIPNSKARIYAAFNSDPAQLEEEVQAATWVCGQIDDAFEASGYSSSNLAGTGTTVSNVYYYAENDEQNYDRIAVFHFGHLSDFNTAYQDNNADNITASGIDDSIDSNKYDFTFIWVCAQAHWVNSGMSEAWTQRDNLSSDGYVSPDEYDQCYIGFYSFSPMISSYHQIFQEQATDPAKYFIKYFYDYALCDSYSVRDALNKATLDFLGTTFTSSILYNGYHAWWVGDERMDPPYDEPGWVYGKMRVFGNGAIWVFQPKITLTANYGLSPKFYLDGEQCSVGDVHVWAPKVVTVDVEEVHNYEFDHFSYHGNTYSAHPANMGLYFDDTLTAVYNWDPVYYALSVSAGTGGTTESPYTPGNHQCLSYSTAHVVADPDDNWALDHWVLDSENAGNDLSIDVLMDEDRTLEAVFTPAPSYNYVSSIHSYGGAVYNQANLVGWQPDSQFARLEGLGYYGVTGWIAGTMNEQATGHIYVKGRCVSGGATNLYVYVSSNGYNWNYVSAPYVSSTSAYWIDCGTYGGTFNYIKVLVQPAGWGALELDSVRVEP